MSIFKSENIENYCPKCCKIALFALKFLKFSGGACPRTPPPPPQRNSAFGGCVVRPQEKSYFFTKSHWKHCLDSGSKFI